MAYHSEPEHVWVHQDFSLLRSGQAQRAAEFKLPARTPPALTKDLLWPTWEAGRGCGAVGAVGDGLLHLRLTVRVPAKKKERRKILDQYRCSPYLLRHVYYSKDRDSRDSRDSRSQG